MEIAVEGLTLSMKFENEYFAIVPTETFGTPGPLAYDIQIKQHPELNAILFKRTEPINLKFTSCAYNGMIAIGILNNQYANDLSPIVRANLLHDIMTFVISGFDQGKLSF